MMMSDKDKKRKYLLFKKDDGRPDSLKPCAFFVSEAGCKNGSNCRFLHGPPPSSGKRSLNDGNDTMSDAGSEVSAMSSVAEEAPPTIGSIRNDHKKRKTNDPADDAPYPVYRVPSVAEDEISKLKDQMALQQKMFEDQLKMLSSKISTQTIDAPPQKNQTQPSIKYPKQQVVSSIEPIYAQQKQAVPSAPKTPAPLSNGKANNRSQVAQPDSSDDEKFLFSTVNQILENGRSDATTSNHKVAKPVPALINNRQEEKQSRMSTPAPASQVFVPKNVENPFLFNVPGNYGVKPPTVTTKSTSAVTVVSSSASTPTPTMGGMIGIPDTFKKGTVFSQQEVKVTESAKRKNIFAKTKHSTTTTVVSAAPKVDFKTLDYKHLNWEELVTKTQSHPRYKMDYNLNVDQSWVSARSR
jgi:hypothetical protein